MNGLVLLLLALATGLFGGSVCGIVAVIRLNSLSRRIDYIERRLSERDRHKSEEERRAPTPAHTAAGQATASKVPGDVPPQEPSAPPHTTAAEPSAPTAKSSTAKQPSTRAVPPPPPRRPAQPAGPGFEFLVGTKWMVWLGMLLVIIGMAFFVKYAYDNNYIGEKGRLAIGALVGAGLLAGGEWVRQRSMSVLFQTLTGGGFAIFYICIFFSFQIYGLSTAQAAMSLGVVISALAVFMAVLHNAASIAILGVLGGFLSPVLLSAGGNHPHALFIYVLVIDLVAFGAGYFRRWRALDLLCFIGTATLYTAWFSQSYDSTQMMPALLYISIFYALFTLTPLLYGLANRLPQAPEGFSLIVANTIFSVIVYYQVLFDEYRYVLGFVVLLQALFVIGLFRIWGDRIGTTNATAQSLLAVSLALVTLAVPITLQDYGMAVAWGVEGTLFAWLSTRFQRTTMRVGAVVALLLSAYALFAELPLHSAPFLPVINVPFAAWVVVIGAMAAATWFLWHDSAGDRWQGMLTAGVGLLAYVLGCFLLTIEAASYWQELRPAHWRNFQGSTLVVLWTLISAATLSAAARYGRENWAAMGAAPYAIGCLFFLYGLGTYEHPATVLFLNATFVPKLLFVLALWWASARPVLLVRGRPALLLEGAGHFLLALLLAAECVRWGGASTWTTQEMGAGLISVFWGIHAVILIGLGLVRPNAMRRYLGLALFGVTVGKTVLIDNSTLDEVYRIASFLGSGILLLAGGVFYMKYSARFLARHDPAAEDSPGNET